MSQERPALNVDYKISETVKIRRTQRDMYTLYLLKRAGKITFTAQELSEIFDWLLKEMRYIRANNSNRQSENRRISS